MANERHEESTIRDNGGDQRTHTARDEFGDLMRGVGGAALIGVPLVYTMEVWDLATFVPARNVFTVLLTAFVLNVGYNYVSGFRKGAKFGRAVMDAIEALAIGALMALFLLCLLGIVRANTPLADAVCKVALEAVPLSFGASVANTQFSGDRQGGPEQIPTPSDRKRRDLMEAGIAVAGSVLFAANIAPTEEVLRIALRMDTRNLLLLMVVSCVLSYLILFVADFTGREQRVKMPGLLQSPTGETALAYGIALLVSFGMVVGLHGLDPLTSSRTTLAATVVLGFPAAIGGAAGRLIT
jgi:putative integral membrane protein (TIGR02587 family)